MFKRRGDGFRRACLIKDAVSSAYSAVTIVVADAVMIASTSCFSDDDATKGRSAA